MYTCVCEFENTTAHIMLRFWHQRSVQSCLGFCLLSTKTKRGRFNAECWMVCVCVLSWLNKTLIHLLTNINNWYTVYIMLKPVASSINYMSGMSCCIHNEVADLQDHTLCVKYMNVQYIYLWAFAKRWEHFSTVPKLLLTGWGFRLMLISSILMDLNRTFLSSNLRMWINAWKYWALL